MARVPVLLFVLIAALAAAQDRVTDLLGGAAAEGYARALHPRLFVFPADHGPHPDYQSEWWYFTGNLSDDDGRHFGFQLTFFRFALAPMERPRASAWGTRQAWMAHFTVTDTATGRFHAAERIGRGALGLAGSESTPFRVWIDGWEAKAATEAALFPLRLSASTGEFAIELELSTSSAPVAQGDEGWDRKGAEPGNASHYYSVPRIRVDGTVTVDGRVHGVSGAAWMDREWSTSALGPELEGWDWLALQFEGGGELMAYRLRRSDGSSSEFSGGMLTTADGQRVRLSAADFVMRPRRWWTSAVTGVRYPVAWSIAVPAASIALEVEPRLDEQELDLSVRYWEGAVKASGHAGDETVSAQGYLELAGYR